MTLASDLALRAQTLGQQVISNLSQFYEGGVFWMSNMSDYHRQGLPAAGLMATLARDSSISTSLKSDYIAMVQEIVEFSIATNLTPTRDAFVNGGVDPYGWFGQLPDAEAMNNPLNPNPNTTIEQVANIGWILYQLPAGVIPDSQRKRWLKVCQDCCTRLDTWPGGSITTYYINGNYQAQLMGAYWFTALASTGPKRLYYQDCYERAYAFIVNPAATSATWTGWGLTIDVSGSENDWSDFQAHLTETSSRVIPGPDFDWNYSAVQMNALSRIFLANRDSRLIRLINAISNKVEPRLDPVTWIRNGAGGSRTTNSQGMIDSYYFITALVGSKSSNRTYLDSTHILSMWDTASTGMSGQFLQNSTNGLYGLGGQLSLALAPVRAAAEIVVGSTVTAA